MFYQPAGKWRSFWSAESLIQMIHTDRVTYTSLRKDLYIVKVEEWNLYFIRSFEPSIGPSIGIENV